MKKSKIWLLISSMLLAVFSFGQYSIQPSIPTGGMVLRNQLWNIIVVNGTNAEPQAKVELSLRNRQTNVEEITATTASFKLDKGAKSLNAQALAPIAYNNISTASTRINNGELIPVGNYNACFRLIVYNNPEGDIVSEECTPFDVEALSPPMLLFPNDSSVTRTPPTNFSWIPPTPNILFTQLQYDFVVAEIFTNQKPEEAIQQNAPFYLEQNIQSNQLPYVGFQNAFVKDKWYAWQIIAKDGNSYNTKSEVWVFKVSDTGVVTKTKNNQYLIIKENELNSIVSFSNRNISYSFDCKNISFNQKIVFKKQSGELMQTEKRLLSYGNNYIDIRLSSTKFNLNQLYVMEITSEDGIIKTIQFILKN